MVLRFQLGLTSPEAAQVTGLADGSVRKILNRGLASLREQLGEPATARPHRQGPATASVGRAHGGGV